MKPNRIILIRHGESQGNVDKSIYHRVPDYAVRLTETGKQQALLAGQQIKDLIQFQNYGIYYSPYFRARETMDLAIENLGYSFCEFKKEEPRIREQEHSGKLAEFDYEKFEPEIEVYGKFFYRLDGGESGADVFDRVSDFIGSLHRDFSNPNYPENCLIFAHGMLNRLFLMRFLKYSVEEFEAWKNPKNGEIYILELQDNNKYKLITEIPKHENGYGYKYSEKLV